MEMSITKLVYITMGMCLGLVVPALAQKGTVATGGVATGTGGSVTYSIGQVDFITVADNGNVISQGLQQAFEILVLKGEEPVIIIDSGPVFSLYPNPARDFVVIKVDNPGDGSLSYGLYDLLGRLIKKETLTGIRTTISLAGLPGANYVVTIFNSAGNKVLKTFKIIKI